MRLYSLLIAWMLLTSGLLSAQELNLVVTVDATRLITQQAAERQIFADMEKAMSDFINKREWTTDRFQAQERIQGKLQITLTESPSQGFFKGTAQLQVTRPVFNTTFETATLNYIDRNFDIQYLQGQPLIYNENSYTDDLTSMLAFYAYVVLAIDYDTFSELGGEPWAQKAFDIANIAQQSGNIGWRRGQDNRSRFWLAENLMSQQLRPFREGLYKYYRQGFDRWLLYPDKAREKMAEFIFDLEEVNRLRPDAGLVNSFFEFKTSELLNVFKDTPLETRKELVRVLSIVDPARTANWATLAQGF
ncbi:DUF4835 family protein [Eisenibacter elegans]|jgi:hypothetical protein|uniref:type IX secretion system protein PorD n=1 Tax=Eisenibacter elegans TaxID=997 RepID=UPI00040B12E4|nr:DUF4835 family protein [Eisenibacter elegans]